ncbi:DUF2147 domain-containing protein [Rhodobacteraceae bacterium RKSG542]|uniref:DUF2147 domain-containing protein n=1 Tax=Pseudovibrio flavus TaxID=2529854 RepID=UPI0012BD6B33|nr:DUF2147 domain-containing protein [Pseudovibrio flavus]MTI16341.1 DUF2147 domain-containing protein [Pseudovibrio flavus]
MNKLMTGLSAAALTLCIGASSALAAGPEGVWKRADGSAKIQMTKCGSEICGKIVWLKNPRKDTQNPKASLRNRDLIGIQILSKMKANGDKKWKGKIYNAEDGKTYTAKMELLSASKLKLQGCALGGLICKGDTWSKSK